MMDLEKSFRAAGREDWHPEEQMDRTHRRLMRIIWVIIAIIGAGIVWSVRDEAKAQGAPTCKPVAEFDKELREGFREVPVGAGISAGGQVAIVIYAAPDGETFTIAVLRSDGQACMIAAGHNLDIGDFPIGGEES